MEIWKSIEGFNGLYQISSYGRIKSLFRNKEKIRKQQINSNYCTINLLKKRYLIHRLVWETFVGPIPEGMQINHIDENTLNNHLDNLCLMSPSENSNYGTRNNRIAKKNKNNPLRSIPVLQYDLDMNLIAEYPSQSEAQRKTEKNKTSSLVFVIINDHQQMGLYG